MYKQKYLKYKNKYLNLKQNGGGTLYIIDSLKPSQILENIDDDNIRRIPEQDETLIDYYRITKQDNDTYRIAHRQRDYGENYTFKLIDDSESLKIRQQIIEAMPKAIPKAMPEAMPKAMPKAMPEAIPEAKSIDDIFQRFIRAQNSGSYNNVDYGSTFEIAIRELDSGQKKTDWIWY